MWNKLRAIFCKDNSEEVRRKSDRWIFGTMLAFGILALLAAFVLSIEEFHLLKNPDAQLSCSFNLIFNCATVMQTWQASVFGFPNMFVGLMVFPVIIMTAVLGLSHVKLPRWFWIAANLGFLASALFAYWLFFQSVYVIETLCPWCLTVTVATTFILATVTHYTTRENTFGFDKKTYRQLMNFQQKDYGKLLVAAWLALLVLLVFLKFGDSLFA